MEKYHKIQSIYKRTERGAFIPGIWSLPEFEYLKDCRWVGTEKIDGTNVRVSASLGELHIAGKTDNAQLHPLLTDRLTDIFDPDKLISIFDDKTFCLYGEGYGFKIQKVGKQYLPNTVDFILFDVWVNGLWLRREDVADIAQQLDLDTVEIVTTGTLPELIKIVEDGMPSYIGDAPMEGIVARPACEMLDRQGNRIITKIKHKDLVRMNAENS